MKKHILALCLASLTFVGCEDFLDVKSYTTINLTNFPETESDMDALVTGLYVSQLCSATEVQDHPYIVGEAASDERFGGGGENDFGVQSLDKLMVLSDEQFAELWSRNYEGIYRANTVLENIDRIEYSSEQTRNTYAGEAHWFRALFYWELVQIFEKVPMPLKTEIENLPRASVDELYAQIGYDFVQAIELLPNQPYSSYDQGRASRWAAEGFLGRVYLFYTGMYQDNNLDAGMPLADGSTLTKSDMMGYLTDCINNSGHGLLEKFGNLFPYSNEYTKKDYQYAQDLDLEWAGECNKEVVYSYKYGATSSSQVFQRNIFIQWQGIPERMSLNELFPFGQGWGFGSVTSNMVDEWKAAEPNDVRLWGSIIDMDTEIPDYRENGFYRWEETLFRSKKSTIITAKDDDGATKFSFTVLMYGTTNTNKSYCNEFVLMRFAEILLMASELSGDASYMNQVRTRAGLESKSYSLEALQAERRWELAFEGVRWNDIRRWGIAVDVLDKQIGETVWNAAGETTVPAFSGGYAARYEATNRGFFMIPASEIALSNGVLDQNAGWSAGDNYTYAGW
ncbi:MAG: RagB/SusD family nutrient uptake outer membrane protein [Rikenellaceae bacterium]